MKRLSASPFLAALGLLLSAAPSAPGSFIAWDFSWVRNGSVVVSDLGSFGAVALTDAPSGHATGNADILATHLRAFSIAPRTQADVFSQRPYGLTLYLTDEATHTTGSLTFTGAFSGTLSAAGAALTNAFNSPRTQQLVVGGSLFTVAVDAFTPPGGPGSATLGSLGATVSVQNSNLPPPPVPADPPPPVPSGPPLPIPSPSPGPGPSYPEPSGLVLGAIGLACLGLAGWQNRKRRTPSSSGSRPFPSSW